MIPVPTAELSLAGDLIQITTTYPDRHLIKQLPGSRFKLNLGAWTAPLGWGTCITLRGLFGDRLIVGPRLNAWSWDLYTNRIQPTTMLRDALEIEVSIAQFESICHLLDVLDHEIEAESSLKLYSYQRVDVAFLYANRRALLCNEPGLGKTGSVIRTIQLLDVTGQKPLPVVIVCPNTLKRTVWKKELTAWAPHLTVSIIDGPAGVRRKALQPGFDVYLINWESVWRHSRLAPYGQIAITDEESQPKELNALDPMTVILDECHRAKNPNAKQTRAAWAITHQAAYRFGMTGTPIGNHLGELWPLFHLIEPTSFPTKTRWMDRYLSTSPNFFGGATVTGLNPATRSEFFRATDHLIRRVPKQLALPQLPPKLPTEYRETPLSSQQRKIYNQMRDLMVAELNEIVIAGNGLAKLTRLSQFACAFAEIGENGNVKLRKPSSKVDDLLELLDDMGDKPLVVGAVSRQLIELAAQALTDAHVTNVLVTGGQSTEKRDENVKQFQAGEARVILCTLGAGAEGLTLTAADTLLFMQRSWSQLQNKQFEDRIHRIGAEGHACVRILEQIAPDTIDEHRVEVLAEKDEQAQSFLRDTEILAKLLGVKIKEKK